MSNAGEWITYILMVVVYVLVGTYAYHLIMESNRLFRRGLLIVELEEGDAGRFFQKADKNQVGRLTKEELKQHLQHHGMEPTPFLAAFDAIVARHLAVVASSSVNPIVDGGSDGGSADSGGTASVQQEELLTELVRMLETAKDGQEQLEQYTLRASQTLQELETQLAKADGEKDRAEFE